MTTIAANARPGMILYVGNKLLRYGFTPTSIETLGPALEKEGYRFVYVSDKKNKVLRLLDMLWVIYQRRRQVDKILIDTYSTSYFYSAWLCGLLAQVLRLPYYPILRGGALPDRLERTPKLCAQLFGGAAANIAISGYLEHAFAEKGFSSVVIPNNIPLEKYPFRYRERVKPRLLWVRSFHETYNPELAVRLMEALSREYPEATLAMVGPDKDGSLERCQDLAQTLGVADKIEFTGRLPKEEWVRRAKDYDIFINTTNFDNTPISVIEAMALGFPIVSTNVGGIPYLLNDGEDSLLTPPDDSEALLRQVRRILEEPDLAEHLSRSARRAAEQWDWEVIKLKWSEILD